MPQLICLFVMISVTKVRLERCPVAAALLPDLLARWRAPTIFPILRRLPNRNLARHLRQSARSWLRPQGLRGLAWPGIAQQISAVAPATCSNTAHGRASFQDGHQCHVRLVWIPKTMPSAHRPRHQHHGCSRLMHRCRGPWTRCCLFETNNTTRRPSMHCWCFPPQIRDLRPQGLSKRLRLHPGGRHRHCGVKATRLCQSFGEHTTFATEQHL